jgi:hypothetical protein
MEIPRSIRLAGLVLLPALSLPPLATAATVHIGECKTQFTSTPPFGVSTVNQASSYTVDLSNVTGLTAGIPIRINCTPDDAFFWLGEFRADTGTLTKQWTVDTEITVGSTTTVFTDSWSIGPLPYVNPGNTSSEVGYSFGPSPITRSITVPWGTDLSQLSFTLRDRSSITATNGEFYQSSMKVSGVTFTTSSVEVPEIAVETSLGANLESAAPVNFGTTVQGSPLTLNFVIRSTGTANLELAPISLTPSDTADFTFTGPVLNSIPGAGFTTFSVTFNPSAGGQRTATLTIPNNDPDESIFTLQLSGTGLTFTADTDLDGLNDAAEFNLAPLGFDWQLPQPALVTTLLTHANGAGLFTTSQVQTLHSGTPLIARNLATGKVKLTMDWKKSTNLSSFADFPASPAQVSVNGSGDIELEFTPADDATFFRVQSN